MASQDENIIGKYNVLDIISRSGGFADVYKVRHMHMGRISAMKVLRDSLADVSPNEPTYPESKAHVVAKMETYFYREGRLLAGLKHPNIIEVYDFDIERGHHLKIGDNKPYFVMPLADGNLAAYINGRRFSPEDAVLLLEQIARGLDFAYDEFLDEEGQIQHIIHLDVKPENVLWMDSFKRLVVTDFGIAKLAGVEPTSFGAGTPPYMAPDRVLDIAKRVYIPHRSADVFSLGVIAYVLFCGVLPHPDIVGNDAVLIYHDLYSKPYTLPTFKSKGVRVNPEIEAVVGKAVAFRKEDRYPTCTAFVEALKEITTRPARQIAAAQKQQALEERQSLEARVRNLEKLVTTLQQAERRAKAAERQKADLQIQLTNLQWEKRQQELEAKQALATRANDLQARLAQAQRSIRELNSLLNQQEKESSVQESALLELQSRLQQASQDIQRLANERATLEQQLQAWNELITADDKKQYSRQQQNLERSIEQLHVSLTQATTQITILLNKNTVLQKKLTEQTEQNSQLVVDNKAMQAAITNQAQILEKYRKTIQEKQRLEANLRALEQQLSSLANAAERAEAAERQLAELRERLQTSQLARKLTAKWVLTYTKHEGAVYKIAWSPDGRYLASGGYDKTVQVFEALSGKMVTTYTGHTSSIIVLTWSPDGRYLASGGHDKTAQVFEALSGKMVTTYMGHTDSIRVLTWSPDGRYLASRGSDKTVHVFEALSGKMVTTYTGHTDVIYCLTWSPNGRYLASGGVDKTVHVFEALSGKMMTTYMGHTSFINALTWSPDGRYLASGGVDNTVQVWTIV